ncbi:MAG: S9 family peptidase [Pseudomonadota bacterium]
MTHSPSTPGPSGSGASARRTALAPRAARRPTSAVHHGQTLRDDYAWLRAANWQDVMRDPQVLPTDIRAHLEAENAYTDAALAETDTLQTVLFEEMKGRIKEDDSTVPANDGPYAYYARYVTGGQYPLFCRRPREGGDESILLDGNGEAQGKAYWGLGAVQHAPDHSLMAYAVDDQGSELYTIKVRDLATGEDLEDAIPDTGGSFVWANDNRSLFYIKLDDNHRPQMVYRHRLGEPSDQDTLIFREQDPGFYVGLGKTQSDRFITIGTGDHQTDEIHLIDADAPESAPVLVTAREPGHEYAVDHHDGDLVILTNSGGAVDFRICRAPVSAPGPDHWVEIIPPKPGRLILSATAYRDHLVRMEREDGLPRIMVRRWDGSDEHAIAFDEEAYSLGMSGGYEFDTTTLRFSYSSMTTPSQVFDYDMVSRTRTLRKTQEVPSGHDAGDYVTRRIHAPAADGEMIPVTLLHHRDTPLDGSAPALLYGYGSYGIAMPAGFSTSRLSLDDHGFIFALAHIRGGKEKGYGWYLDGKMANKMNTFTDFIAAGEHLVSEGLTQRGRLVAHGGSAGGMLVGASANMAPDLFNGIIADVPFVDVLNTMLDATLPLTPPEWLEWGNPIESAEQFARIKSYCPYTNVSAQAYPHIYAYAGLTDPRVTYWEPAKWIAKLREHKTDDNLLMLKVNMEGGHAGASGRFDSLKELARAYAFALLISERTDATAGRGIA